jgi:hypothetical protein
MFNHLVYNVKTLAYIVKKSVWACAQKVVVQNHVKPAAPLLLSFNQYYHFTTQKESWMQLQNFFQLHRKIKK